MVPVPVPPPLNSAFSLQITGFIRGERRPSKPWVPGSSPGGGIAETPVAVAFSQQNATIGRSSITVEQCEVVRGPAHPAALVVPIWSHRGWA